MQASTRCFNEAGIELMEEELVAAHIQTQSNGQVTLAHIRQQRHLIGALFS